MGISKTFMGLILLPIVGNAVEHATAVMVAIKGKTELALGVAIGSATQVLISNYQSVSSVFSCMLCAGQIAVFVLPLVTLMGWILDQPMTLAFPVYEVRCFLYFRQVDALIRRAFETAELLYLRLCFSFYPSSSCMRSCWTVDRTGWKVAVW